VGVLAPGIRWRPLSSPDHTDDGLLRLCAFGNTVSHSGFLWVAGSAFTDQLLSCWQHFH